MKSRARKVLATLFACVLAVGGFAACGGDSSDNGGTRIDFWGITDQYTNNAVYDLVDAYNTTQGKKDGVSVKLVPKMADYSASLLTTLMQNNVPDVVLIQDKLFKANAVEGNFANLNSYVEDTENYVKDDDGKTLFDMTDYADGSVDRFRYDIPTNTAGAGQNLYALPYGEDPETLFYNATKFAEKGVNIVSIAESDIAAYNEANGTTFVARGYSEYAVSASPKTGLTQSRNRSNKMVVKVFNNQIPMSWNELIELSNYFTEGSGLNKKYGYLSEWWFQYGWTVGGDCLAYDNDLGAYKFTLGSTLPGYIATSDITINNVSFSAGDVVDYSARKYIAANTSNEAMMAKLYAIPSQYEAFREFCALSQETTKYVDSTMKGYGISPSPSTLDNKSKVTYFTTGSVAMVCEQFSASNSINKGVGSKWKWDIAPMYQYREYEGGEKTADGEFKVIGEPYDDAVFSGQVKKVGDAQITGNFSTASFTSGVAIPEKSDNKTEAWKFLQWLTTEGQKYLATTNSFVPATMSYAASAEYSNTKGLAFKNTAAAALLAKNSYIGDWSYLDDGEWVHNWANVLNTDVRNGSLKLDAFFTQVQKTADDALAKYKVKLMGK